MVTDDWELLIEVELFIIFASISISVVGSFWLESSVVFGDSGSSDLTAGSSRVRTTDFRVFRFFENFDFERICFF